MSMSPEDVKGATINFFETARDNHGCTRLLYQVIRPDGSLALQSPQIFQAAWQLIGRALTAEPPCLCASCEAEVRVPAALLFIHSLSTPEKVGVQFVGSVVCAACAELPDVEVAKRNNCFCFGKDADPTITFVSAGSGRPS